jgi:hypothetical protein
MQSTHPFFNPKTPIGPSTTIDIFVVYSSLTSHSTVFFRILARCFITCSRKRRAPGFGTMATVSWGVRNASIAIRNTPARRLAISKNVFVKHTVSCVPTHQKQLILQWVQKVSGQIKISIKNAFSPNLSTFICAPTIIPNLNSSDI